MIGLFDSGVGGLTVLKELLNRAPGASFAYLGDTARTPYGNKGAEKIIEYSLQNAGFLIDRGATVIVVACNSASAVAMDALRETFPNVTFYDVISPAVNRVCSEPSVKKVGVIGTRATIGSNVYETLLQAGRAGMGTISTACPLFVPLAEEGWQGKPETKRIARRYLKPIREAQVDALILGCTHYPLLEKEICAAVQKRVRIIDSPSAVMDRLEAECPELLSSEGSSQSYFFTDCSEHTARIARAWLGKPIACERAELQ